MACAGINQRHAEDYDRPQGPLKERQASRHKGARGCTREEGEVTEEGRNSRRHSVEGAVGHVQGKSSSQTTMASRQKRRRAPQQAGRGCPSVVRLTPVTALTHELRSGPSKLAGMAMSSQLC